MTLSLNKITFRYRIGFRFSAEVKRKKIILSKQNLSFCII